MPLCYPSAFIVLEGIDCCGKSTQLKLLADGLMASGHRVEIVSDPGTTEMGKAIRKLLLDPVNKEFMTPGTELMLFAAARASLVDHLRSVIKKHPETIILSDRFIHSTIAYQHAGRGISHGRVTDSIMAACAGFFPTLTIIIDVDEKVVQDRMLSRAAKDGKAPDRLDEESQEFRSRVRQGYLNTARNAFIGYGDVEVLHDGGEHTADSMAKEINHLVISHLRDRQADHQALTTSAITEDRSHAAA